MDNKLSSLLSHIKTDSSSLFSSASVARWNCPNDAESIMDMDSHNGFERMLESWRDLVIDFQKLEVFLSHDLAYLDYKQREAKVMAELFNVKKGR